MKPLVTIIIPTYNSQATLDECLQSIISQTYTNKEVIIVDGLSKDKTPEIIDLYKSKYLFIKSLSEKDAGVYDAMNKGIDMAKGDFLYFLGSDDVFVSNGVLDEIFSVQENLEFDFIYGNVFLKHSKFSYSGESDIEKLIGDQISICHQAIFYKRNVFDIIGKYDLKYFIHADYDFNVKCFENPTIKKKFIDKDIALYNEFGLSMEPNKDGFNDALAMHYMTKYSSPFQLILKMQNLRDDISHMKRSRAFKFVESLKKVNKMRKVVPNPFKRKQ